MLNSNHLVGFGAVGAVATHYDYPTVVASAKTESAAATSHNVNMPTGIASGDLLVMLFVANNGPTVTRPTGWTLLEETTGGSLRFNVWYRVADGSEGSTVAVSISTSQKACAVVARIESHNSSTNAPDYGGNTSTTTSTWNITTVTPAGGAKNYLWLACVGYGGTTLTLSANPTGFETVDTAALSSGPWAHMAWDQLNAASLNPDAGTVNTNSNGRFGMVAIHPGTQGD